MNSRGRRGVSGAMLLLLMCGTVHCRRAADEETNVASDGAREAAMEKVMWRKQGALLFTEKCAGCHGSDGIGGGAYPPLAGSEWVLGDAQRLYAMVRQGIFGAIQVKGKRYGQESMPGWQGQLSAGQSALILSYIRQAWGNQAAGVKEEEITAWEAQLPPSKGPIEAKKLETGEWRQWLGISQ